MRLMPSRIRSTSLRSSSMFSSMIGCADGSRRREPNRAARKTLVDPDAEQTEVRGRRARVAAETVAETVHRDEHHVAGTGVADARRVANAAIRVAKIRRRSRVVREHDRKRRDRVILETVADRQRRAHVDAEFGQMIGRADAGTQQDRRAVNRAGRQDDLVGVDVVNAAARHATHADRAIAVEQHGVDERVAQHGKVVAATMRIEVRVVCVDARVIAAVDRVWRYAERARRVVIRRPRVAEIDCTLRERKIDRAPSSTSARGRSGSDRCRRDSRREP